MKANAMLGLALWALFAWAAPGPALAEKASAPVDIAYDAPKGVRTGDTVQTVVRFTPRVSLLRLVVSFAPLKGVELLSGTGPFEFVDVASGGVREVTVQVRLVDAELGYLSVFATAETATHRSGKSAAIPYGVAGAATMRKLGAAAGNVTTLPDGQRLILMEAEKP